MFTLACTARSGPTGCVYLEPDSTDSLPELVLLKFRVKAHNIVDLRDPVILFAAGVNLADGVSARTHQVRLFTRPGSCTREVAWSHGLEDLADVRPS